MKQGAKTAFTGLAMFVLGGVLVVAGVGLWVDGSTSLGAGLAFAGAFLFILWVANLIERRKRARRPGAEDKGKGENG